MEAIEPILDTLMRYLQANPVAGEHEMIQNLQQQNIAPFPTFNLKHSRELFSAHFLIKHCLYLLQKRGLSEQTFVLQISATQIQMNPYHAGAEAITRHDPVREYYLNLDHYFETTEEDVVDLLNNFWRRYLIRDDKQAALEVFDLDNRASMKEVTQAYRKLVQQKHPDKGGSKAEFLKIQAAKELLATVLKT